MSSTHHRTYAQTTSFPTRNQAIVMHVTEGLSLKDYIYGIGTLIGPSNIIFSSRISNNRICMYLKTSKLADEVTHSHPTVNINNTYVRIRKLINPSKRLLISNISPHIPHAILEQALINIHLKTTSPVSFLRAGLNDEEYKHILSFRRQVFVISENEIDTPEPPDTLLIDYEGESYRIFLSLEEHWCSICKSPDHSTNSCSQKRNNIPTTSQSEDITSISLPANSNESSIITNYISPLDENTNLEPANGEPTPTHENLSDLEQTTNTEEEENEREEEENDINNRTTIPAKRPLSTESSPSQNEDFPELQPPKSTSKNQSSNKKTKTEPKIPPANIKQILNSVKELIHQQTKTIKNSLTQSQITQLLETYKSQATGKEILQASNLPAVNIHVIITQLQTVHSRITDRSTKIRITKTIEKLQEELKDGDSPNAMEC